MALALSGVTVIFRLVGTSTSKTVPTPSIGDILIVTFAARSATPANMTVSDNQGNTWVQVFTPVVGSLTPIGFWYTVVTATGTPFAITTNGGAGTVAVQAIYQRWLNPDVNPVKAGEFATNSATSGSSLTVPVLATSRSSGVMFFTMTSDSGATITITETAGRSLEAVNQVGGPLMGLWIMPFFQPTSASDAWTISTAAFGWATASMIIYGTPTVAIGAAQGSSEIPVRVISVVGY